MYIPAISKHLVSILTITLLFTSVSINAKTNDPDLKWLNKQQWSRIDTANFVIYTDLKEKVAVNAALQIESFVAFSDLVFRRDKKEAHNHKTMILMIGGKHAWRKLGMDTDLVGNSTYRGNKAYIASQVGFGLGKYISKPSLDRALLFQQITTAYTFNSELYRSFPTWFKTGYAWYIGTYIEEKERITTGDPRSMWYRGSLSYNNGGLRRINLAAFLGESNLPDNLSSSEERRRFDAQSYVIAHYLFSSKERTEKLRKFLNLVVSGTGDKEAFTQAFNASIDEVEAEIMSYAKNRSMVTTYDKKILNKYLDIKTNVELVQVDFKQVVEAFFGSGLPFYKHQAIRNLIPKPDPL